jgi:hypothetical protein
MRGELDTPGDEGIPGIWEQEMRMTNAKVAAAEVAAAGVGAIFGQQASTIANSGRPENRPDPFEVERQLGAAGAKGLAVAGRTDDATHDGELTSRESEAVSRDVNSPKPESRCADSGGARLSTATTEHGVFGDNKAGDVGCDSSSPSKELLIENRHESSQGGEQQSVRTQTKAEKVLIKTAVAAKPLKPLSERLDYMRRPYTKPASWPEPPPGKEWLQDPEYLYELGMQNFGYPIAPSLCQWYRVPRRRSETNYS